MSRIQRQVILHSKKNAQLFSLDCGLNKLGFHKYRHYNLKQSFGDFCRDTR